MYSILMQALVKLLRRQGVLLPREQIDAAPWVAVTLLSDRLTPGGRRLAMWPEGHGGQVGADGAVRELYGVTVQDVLPDRMILRGIERWPTGQGLPAAVLQEWMIRPVPDLGPSGWHSPMARQFTRDVTQLVHSP